MNSVNVMFFGSLILGFFVISSLMVNNFGDIKPSVGKFYAALWMALWMVLIMVWGDPNSIAIVVVALIVVFYLARQQTLIGDDNYLRAMIQHHSSAILTSKQILEKTENEEVRKLAVWIKDSQQNEIDLMNRLLKKS